MASSRTQRARDFLRERRTEATAGDGRLSVADVVNALGVRRDRVRRWVLHGWLRAEVSTVANSTLYIFEESDLIRFLFKRGALLRDINPDAEWEPHVLRARAALLRSSVEHRALARQLGLVSGYLAELQKTKGFPKKFIAKGWRNQTFYHRTEIYRWLEERPIYDERGTVRRWLTTYRGDFS